MRVSSSRAARLSSRRARIGQVVGRERVAVVSLHPVDQLPVERVVDQAGRVHGRPLLVGEHDAQAQAGGAAAVSHALPQIEDALFGDGLPLADVLFEPAPHGVDLVALLGGDEGQPFAARHAHELRVEEIRAHGVFDAHRRGVDPHRDEAFDPGGQGVDHRLALEEGLLVEEEHALGADGDDVVVEDAAVDDLRGLLDEDAALGRQAVKAGDGLAGFEGLSGGEAPRRRVAALQAVAAEDEEVQAGRADVGGEAGVVGGAFVAEGLRGGQRRVHLEARGIAEDGRERAAGGLGLDGAVGLLNQVGGREMDAAVLGVGARRDRGRVRGPHRRRARRGGQERSVVRRLRDDLRVAPAEAEPSQERHVRALLRRQHALHEPELGERLHLAEPLQRGLLGRGGGAPVRGRGDVAVAEARVVVGRPDQAVEVRFRGAHVLAIAPTGSRVAALARSPREA